MGKNIAIAGSIGKVAKFGFSSKWVRHATLVSVLPALCIALAILHSKGVLNLYEAPGSYFFSASQFSASTAGQAMKLLMLVIGLFSILKKRYCLAAYSLSLGWVLHFLHSLQ